MTYDGYVRETFTAIPPGRTDCPGCAALRAEVVLAQTIRDETLLAAWSKQKAEADRLREKARLLQTALDDQRERLAVAEEERDALREELRLRPTEDALRSSNAILHEWRGHAGAVEADRDRLVAVIREYLAAHREVADHSPAWSHRLHEAEVALLNEVKP